MESSIFLRLNGYRSISCSWVIQSCSMIVVDERVSRRSGVINTMWNSSRISMGMGIYIGHGDVGTCCVGLGSCACLFFLLGYFEVLRSVVSRVGIQFLYSAMDNALLVQWDPFLDVFL